MKSHLALLSAVLLALTSWVEASPATVHDFIAVPTFHRHSLNGTGSGHRLIQHDRARAKQLFRSVSSSQRRGLDEPVQNGVVSFTIQVNFYHRLRR